MLVPTMTPAAGERLLRYLGDRVTFTIACEVEVPASTAFLRTNLGRARRLRSETIAALGGQGTFAGGSWRDIAMRLRPRATGGGSEWFLDLPMTEIGFFQAKPYVVNGEGTQSWPAGSDLGLSIQPSDYRTANTIYCAFTRMFGKSKTLASTRDALRDGLLKSLDQEGYTAIPPSGTFRELAAELPHIVERLGCRILHLLPVGPTPTTYARYGRFGSPYAQQDLIAIDPALVEFDRRTTAVEQFVELTATAQRLGCRVLLDIVINHTGWGATLLDQHPEWFKRTPDGAFHSPGAWGNTWEDLVELDNTRPALWEVIAQALIVWCRRGVNGFRCDAGYMVPLPAWQFIVCRVRQEFPRTMFLLEGLGGSWAATEALLTAGGMQWAYSELFQNFTAVEINRYLTHSHGLAASCGVLVHYSETHDNDRLAKGGRAWSLFRNRLSALTSQAGAYGFTAGVEWLADEKLEVHQSRGLRWGASDNLVEELATLNRLLADDPCFFAGAQVTVLDCGEAVALLRQAAPDEPRQVLVLANPERNHACTITIASALWDALAPTCDLLGGPIPASVRAAGGAQVPGVMQVTLPPLACVCLAANAVAPGTGDRYRRMRAQAGWAYACLGYLCGNEHLGPADWRELATWVAADPLRFLAAASQLDRTRSAIDLLAALHLAAQSTDLPTGLTWTEVDATRDVPVPCGFWVLVHDAGPFRITLTHDGGTPLHLDSVAVASGHVTALPPQTEAAWQRLELVRGGRPPVTGRLLRLPQIPDFSRTATPDADDIALLTNGRGGMARLGVDLGRIHSKYDCLLGANLHSDAPSDRQVLAKRLRAWVNADGFVTPLGYANLEEFTAGPPAVWRFRANAGDGRTVVIDLTADLLAGRNTTVMRLSRPASAADGVNALPAQAVVRLILRVDVEDRSFHGETQHTPEAEQYFARHTAALPEQIGFAFTPAADRRLRVTCDHGRYHHETEWCTGIPHPVEATRGMTASGDARSPGWFEITVAPGGSALLVVDAEAQPPATAELHGFAQARATERTAILSSAGCAADDLFGQQLTVAARAYVVRRGTGRTVIAGYPWFLDWGRDTFIAARGLLAAGLRDDVLHLLTTFGRFEEGGTLPNLLNGDRAENRDTCDAPLWYAIVLEELAASEPTGKGNRIYQQEVHPGRTLSDVVRSIACGYLAGTSNGIRVDLASALVWSPAHFTWMDTNYPAGTPRQGYPVEIQVLWIRLLRHLAWRKQPPADGHRPWSELAEQALASLLRFFWLEEKGYFADQLLAAPGVPAERGLADDALRPNQIFAISLGVISGELARRATVACMRHLVVPGALRSLAPLAVSIPLDLRSSGGQALNDPFHPYVGIYAGDEDTKRKPAYHNGTAWTWPFPSLCEALASAWDHSPAAVSAARSLLGSMDLLLADGCVGQIPEILDGDTPHRQRGCDAQAWGVTEALRVWKALGERRAR